jgi:hypothetical protein
MSQLRAFLTLLAIFGGIILATWGWTYLTLVYWQNPYAFNGMWALLGLGWLWYCAGKIADR